MLCDMINAEARCNTAMETMFDVLSAGDARADAILAPGRAPLSYAELRETAGSGREIRATWTQTVICS
jgi:hypothetical protein